MCGIFGIINTNTGVTNSKDFISDAFVAGSLRGMDSSGIALIPASKKLTYTKLPVNGSMFIQDKAAKTLIDKASSANTILIGHNRAATLGEVSISNAHPFIVQKADRSLIGVHNGTLHNYASKNRGKFDVDSEWALNHIFNEGYDAFEDFYGAYCFVWWDSESPTLLNIALNDKRPMHVAFTKTGGRMLYASEAGMLGWLAARNNIELDGNIIRLADHHWYKFAQSDLKNFTKVRLPEPATYSTGTSSYSSSGTNTRSYGNYSTYTYAGTEAALEALFAKVRAEPTTNNVVALPSADASRKVVTQEEMQLAKDIQVFELEGDFVVKGYSEDLTTIEGSFTADGWDMGAIIRHMRPGLPLQSGERWTVKALGVLDIPGIKPNTAGQLYLICSKPRAKLVDPPMTSATIN